MKEPSISRRRFLTASSGLAASLLAPLARPAGSAGLKASATDGGADLQVSQGAQPPVPGARFVRTLTLGHAARSSDPPLNRRLGAGLDARLFTDLSGLSPGAMVTPNEYFFIRTECPADIGATRPSTLAIGGNVRRPRTLGFDTIEPLITGMGTHLLECAGNSNPNNYGLMSVAQWDGIPIRALLDRLQPSSSGFRVLVSGVDDERHPSRTSTSGASWIFSRDDLDHAHAFLATHMNGVPLPRHHGAPIRLVVPGWYGCACIKWVNRIDLVEDGVAATSQMREFAARTHQPQDVTLAREFTPAVIDLAAMPIRVEQWAAGGHPVYRIIGIVWGGSKPAHTLQIRVRSGAPWVDVGDYHPPESTAVWSLWSHIWQPPEPGRYEIVLRTTDPAIRTRRLDLFFYVRLVDISET